MLNSRPGLDLEAAKLLVVCGFLTPHALDKALAHQRVAGAGIREALRQFRYLDDQLFDAAECIVEEVRAGRIAKFEARSAVYMLGHCRMSVAEVRDKLGQTDAPQNPWLRQLNMLPESR